MAEMSVKNYYALELDDLNDSIAHIREWLWRFQNNYEDREMVHKAYFALSVAISARNIYVDRKNDPWIQMVIDCCC